MSAYIIVRADVHDLEQYKKYAAGSPALVAKFGGKFLVRGPEIVTLEGPVDNRRIVVLEFPNMERAEAFYRSPEYSELKKLRADAAQAQFILVDGYSA